MSAYIAFTKKEMMESFRTYKFIILLAVFVLIGILSPLTALMLPGILQSFNTPDVPIILPEPTAMDSWVQFFNNVGQTGMVVVVIMFSGIMGNEFSRDTLIILLAKGLKRRTVILSKFTAVSLIWTVAYLLCLGVTFGYTAYLWGIELENGLLAFGGM